MCVNFKICSRFGERTRTYIRHILKQEIESTKCRLYNLAEETVQHLSSGCSAIASTRYLGRRNNTGKVVHQILTLNMGLRDNFVPHHLYTPQPVLENDLTKIYWSLIDRSNTTDLIWLFGVNLSKQPSS